MAEELSLEKQLGIVNTILHWERRKLTQLEQRQLNAVRGTLEELISLRKLVISEDPDADRISDSIIHVLRISDTGCIQNSATVHEKS